MARAYTNLEARVQYKQRLAIGIGLFKGIRITCDHCGKLVPSDMNWECVRCDHINGKTKRSSFLSKCSQCKFVPKSYLCPHCGSNNLLDGENEDSQPVKRYIPPTIRKLRPSKKAEASSLSLEQKRKAEIEELKHNVLVARLNLELVRLMASSEFKRELSKKEKLETELEEYEEEALGARILAKRKKEQYFETFKDDPIMLEEMNLVIDAWLERHT